MPDTPLVDVPIGARSDAWVTVAPQRRVLLVAHNLTTVTRLLDVICVFDSDPRVQVVASWSGSDPFHRDLDQVFTDLGVVTVPWVQALHTRFDLAIAASHHGGLADLNSPLVILSHGIGYTKNSPGNRKPETGNRKPETGNRKPETGNRQTFGLSPQWLLDDGRPIADALVLSHPEQLDRLRAAVPEVAHTAVIAGDPCFDRIRASLGLRRRYRRLIAGDERRKIVVVSSTWSAGSTFGRRPDLLRHLMSELPLDYQVVGIVHPNTWAGHGPWQIRTWLADCLRAGLVLVPPAEGWRAALIAADCLIGDIGATTAYGSAIDVPTLLAAFPEDNVAAGSPVAVLGDIAARLDPRESLRTQIDRAIALHRPGAYDRVTELVTSVPDESPKLLRALFYRLMNVSEPDGEAPLWRIPTAGLPGSRPVVSALEVQVELGRSSGSAVVTQFPAELRSRHTDLTVGHIVCHIDHPGRRLLASADVLYVLAHELAETAEEWITETLRVHQGCGLAAVVDADSALVGSRDGRVWRVSAADPVRQVSVLRAWLVAGERPEAADGAITLVS
ncbi:hypothetical protein [Lentzea guizhouensis]|uniref:hypothetical protein n=1 Tax=Lentzea guizhouensis TaxID=1586287 RepID=UPI000AD1F19B|nr:hypothetical protein [Lentzea guizhouensis]